MADPQSRSEIRNILPLHCGASQSRSEIWNKPPLHCGPSQSGSEIWNKPPLHCGPSQSGSETRNIPPRSHATPAGRAATVDKSNSKLVAQNLSPEPRLG
eukprot:1188905-Prorocentrum_minimum.AAC.2